MGSVHEMSVSMNKMYSETLQSELISWFSFKTGKSLQSVDDVVPYIDQNTMSVDYYSDRVVFVVEGVVQFEVCNPLYPEMVYTSMEPMVYNFEIKLRRFYEE
jgi:hypothetical protein